MPFRPTHLRYFVTVAEEGQVTSAARRLQIAQPALSQAISRLESELGLQLLERHAKGVRLTDAGAAFLEKARAVVETEREVSLTAESLARAARGVLEVGFIGPPPPLVAHGLFSAFAEEHPDCEVSFRELPFPRGDARGWLETVDVALCQPPTPEPGVLARAVRVEPRALVVAEGHRLAGADEARLEEVLDETFISYRGDVQPAWAGFHSLDDHRGAPPAASTADNVATSLEMLGCLATATDAVTALPLTDAKLIAQVLAQVRALPIVDAAPASVSLVWSEENAHPRLPALLDSATAVAG